MNGQYAATHRSNQYAIYFIVMKNCDANNDNGTEAVGCSNAQYIIICDCDGVGGVRVAFDC